MRPSVGPCACCFAMSAGPFRASWTGAASGTRANSPIASPRMRLTPPGCRSTPSAGSRRRRAPSPCSRESPPTRSRTRPPQVPRQSYPPSRTSCWPEAASVFPGNSSWYLSGDSTGDTFPTGDGPSKTFECGFRRVRSARRRNWCVRVVSTPPTQPGHHRATAQSPIQRTSWWWPPAETPVATRWSFPAGRASCTRRRSQELSRPAPHVVWMLETRNPLVIGHSHLEGAMSFTVFDPTDGPVVKAFAPAPRLTSLAGKVVGILDNGKHKSDVLLREVQELLRSEAGVKDFVVVRKASAYRPAPTEQLDDLARRVDAAGPAAHRQEAGPRGAGAPA